MLQMSMNDDDHHPSSSSDGFHPIKRKKNTQSTGYLIGFLHDFLMTLWMQYVVSREQQASVSFSEALLGHGLVSNVACMYSNVIFIYR